MLSPQEAGQLENWGQWPKCAWHHHCKKREAVELVKSGEHRWVGGEDTMCKSPVTMIVANRVTIWRPVQAHDFDGRAIVGFKTWGLAPRR